MRNAWILVGLAVFAGPAAAQSEAPAKPAPEAETSVPETPAGRTGAMAAKKRACRETGLKDGLRGPDLGDHIQLCVEEAKLACLKQAVAQKVRGPERREFVLKCVDAPS